jgi:glycosyl transferase, family 25
MRIYVLNLARACARKRTIARSAAALGVTLDFIEAVDGRHLDDGQRALVDHGRRRKITPYPLADGEIGCWLSHRRALQALVDSGESMAAILEDDVALLPDFPAVLQAIQAQGGVFDIVTLHRNFARQEAFVDCRRLVAGIRLGRIAYMQTGNVGYVISRQAAKRFLAATPRFVHAVDKEMHRYWASGLDIYALSHPVVRHDDAGHSFLEETRLDRRPQDRARYPDADRIRWRLQRLTTKTLDTIAKRAAFAAYVRLGRNADWETRLGAVRRLNVKLHAATIGNPARHPLGV